MPIKTKSDIDIEFYLENKKILIDKYLKKLFSGSNYVEPKKLWDALRYSVINGGKRIRGILCLATCESLMKNFHENELLLNDCLTVIASIELIHAMSLVHDDLPSMDNDDLRRGKPSCHKAFNEATAILAGDAMLTLATYLITNNMQSLSDKQKLEIISTLTKAFTFGLVPGQILDLTYEDKNADLKVTETIYTNKTAALIKASVICGAIMCTNKTQEENITKKLSVFGHKVGIAFQIIDDVLDRTSDTNTLGKTSGKDEKQKKSTYPALIGIENSKKMAEELIKEAKLELISTNINFSLLTLLADYIIKRIY